ncbi:MAG: hypothetical protein RBS68_03600 [Anaerolineales bacterium]|jgi:hypothetical protein|nr:hypothetical protein [Anaerolineales bacterium]
MTKKLQLSLIFLLLSILALSGLAFQAVLPFFQIDPPTPESGVAAETEEDTASLISQAANSDGITVMGILIFLIIFVPLWQSRKDGQLR